MNNDWKDFLLQNGGKQDDNGLFVFNEIFADNSHANNSTIICDLSHFSTVVIAGEDAADSCRANSPIMSIMSMKTTAR